MTEQFANTAVTTLNGSITSGATSIVVTSSALFPSVGNFRAIIDTEIILVTAVSGTTWTVVRAQEGTTGAAHADLAIVTNGLTKGAIVQLKTDVYASVGADSFVLPNIASLASAASAAGNFTVGVQFYSTIATNVAGVRFYWAVASSKSVKVQLWDNGGSSQANATQTVASTGIYEKLFSSPVAISANTLYKVSAYQTDAANYVKSTLTNANLYVPQRPMWGGPVTGGGIVYTQITFFLAGDAHPTSTAATEAYYLEPILA